MRRQSTVDRESEGEHGATRRQQHGVPARCPSPLLRPPPRKYPRLPRGAPAAGLPSPPYSGAPAAPLRVRFGPRRWGVASSAASGGAPWGVQCGMTALHL